MELLLMALPVAAGLIVLLPVLLPIVLCLVVLAGAMLLAFMVLWPMESALCAKAAPEQARPKAKVAAAINLDICGISV